MKLKATNADLLEIERQINGFPFALQCLLNSRIKDWMKENPKLSTIKDKIAKMHDTYFEMDENNKPKQRQKLILTKEELQLPEDQRPLEMVMKEGKTLEEYLKEQKEYLSTEIEIIF